MIRKNVRENDPNSGRYTLPGGNLDLPEKSLNNLAGRLKAGVRETKEETGLNLLIPKNRGVILFDNKDRVFDNWKNPQDFLVYVIQGAFYSGKLKSETEEGFPCWVDEREIPKLPQNPEDVKMYEWLKDGRFFIGVIKHKGKELDADGTFVDYFQL